MSVAPLQEPLIDQTTNRSVQPIIDLAHRTLQRDISIQREPFPYFVLDEALPKSVYEDMLAHWPEQSMFDGDRTDGCALIALTSTSIWEKFTDAQQTFWHDFAYKHVPDMVRASMLVYGQKAYQKYGAWLEEIIVYQINITEAFKPLKDLNIHAHHINSPTFIGTCILYVDDNENSMRGTTIHGVKDKSITLAQYADICASLTYEERTELELKASVEFHNNRLLSISDSPMSFHGVPDCREHGINGPRKMLTIQWGAPGRWIDEKYGVSSGEHFDLRKHLPLDQRVQKLINDDIEICRTPADIDAHSYYQWLKTLGLNSHKKLEFIKQPLFPDH